jgi:hypothetical protein
MSNEFDEYDRASFQLDPKAKSFQMTGFRWSHAPSLLASLAFYFLGPAVIAFGLSFLNNGASLIILSLALSYLAVRWFGKWRSDVPGQLPPRDTLSESFLLSERVKAIADDPDRVIEAIKAYREESGAGLADAKSAVEAYVRRESQPG